AGARGRKGGSQAQAPPLAAVALAAAALGGAAVDCAARVAAGSPGLSMYIDTDDSSSLPPTTAMVGLESETPSICSARLSSWRVQAWPSGNSACMPSAT